MKKNIIGHMTTPPESVGTRFKRLNLLPKLLCLLLALIIWLMIVDVTELKMYDRYSDTKTTETAK